MNNFIIYIALILCGITTAISIIVAINNRRRINKRQQELDDHQIKMPYDREIFEKNLVSMSDAYTITPTRLEDYYQIFLPTSNILPITNKIYNHSFFEAIGIDLEKIELLENKVCCLSPFYPTYRKVYNSISSACTQCGMYSVRTDDEYVPKENLTKNIIRSIAESPLIIAVLDGKNPNVTYEIGIAHALGKPVILVINLRQINDVPLHFRDKQLVYYQNVYELEEKLIHIIIQLKKNVDNNSQESKFRLTQNK